VAARVQVNRSRQYLRAISRSRTWHHPFALSHTPDNFALSF
jgi:hypothetical protein